ncbi:hypothetical protein PVL29_026675 [Vitis rotundifolia]|uniref:Glycosyltransferase n=1 Tax=Vitis rotundifolia TaxID=103349 RepID=A0AA39D3Z0_VITRO|nr:hypothetical protein PVL29_026675 [Vitis rotundifolia]
MYLRRADEQRTQASSAMDDPEKLHIVMFPWLAFGHILPYLELSKLIAQEGHRISFISTPRNIDRLPKLPQNLQPLIDLVKFPLPNDDNLPENAEATTDLPYGNIPYLKKAFDGLQEPVTRFLETSHPDWVIHDFAPHWLPPIAAKHGVSRAFFCLFSATAICFGGSTSIMMEGGDPRTELHQFAAPPPWVTFPTKVALPLFLLRRSLDVNQANVSGVSDNFRMGSAILGCDVFSVRSCTELEPEWLDLLGKLHQKPLFPIGLLPPSAPVNGDDDSWPPIREWLDKQEKESVVYVALGTEVTPTEDELTELAFGLELSGLPFFWALRKRNDSVDLPDGFEERTKARGMVWRTWAPQLRILDHESVGGFVTHCGWSSAIEGLHFGQALIMLPLWGDQGLNARTFEEMKVGVEIPRDQEEERLSRKSVAETLSLVMVEEAGKIYRNKAKEISKLLGDKHRHHRYVSDFVEHLQKHRPCV